MNAQPESRIDPRLRAARDKLVQRWLSHPEVQLIDIGYPPGSAATTGVNAPISLRIHIRADSDPQQLGLPQEIDGFPVVFIRADYELQ